MTILKAGVENALMIFNLCKFTGRPAIFPTDTIYGIGAPISSIEANIKVFEIKKRSLDMKLPLIVGSMEQAMQYADFSSLNDEARSFLNDKWPGHYTFIMKANPHVSDFYTKNGTIAIRYTPLEWLAEALVKLGEPICATSVNHSGEDSLDDLENILKLFNNEVYLYLEGVSMCGINSHIYDLSSDSIIQIR